MDTGITGFAPAKINLFLEILGKRQDGFHELVTVMEAIAIGDRVTAWPAAELAVTADRPDVPNGPDNLAFRIIRAAETELGRPLPARIHLEKEVPPGSGLGAGSSDAACALDLVLRLHRVDVDLPTRLRIAASVGSDTAFFVTGGVAVCRGRGEIVEPLPHRGVRHVVLILPGVACNTGAVYRALEAPAQPRDVGPLLRALDVGATLAVGGTEHRPFNRLSTAAEKAYPALIERRQRLTALAGRPPILSGSGGSFYYLCSSQYEARRLHEVLTTGDPSLEVRRTASYRLPART